MISLNNLKPARGAVTKPKRVGRGYGSGTGKTAGRGMNGARSRTGYSKMRGFEGGQMPLHRRLPKRGFTNIFKQQFNIVNLDALDKTGLNEINLGDYFEHGLARKKRLPVKVLGNGKLTRKMVVHAHHFSESAKAKIEKAGGKAVLFEGE
jgi:large subunit ribosomal protein L15